MGAWKIKWMLKPDCRAARRLKYLDCYWKCTNIVSVDTYYQWNNVALTLNISGFFFIFAECEVYTSSL